jgi:hypothetical protein
MAVDSLLNTTTTQGDERNEHENLSGLNLMTLCEHFPQ